VRFVWLRSIGQPDDGAIPTGVGDRIAEILAGIERGLAEIDIDDSHRLVAESGGLYCLAADNAKLRGRLFKFRTNRTFFIFLLGIT